ncbi:hypothetical protein ACONUD_02295 [Microbulbifer harenosus]|uniref:hypothetical protein n=1 Tax=Microbulbifer harenosus TaxID=2576840 RepID=UPI003BA3972C
MAKDFASPTLAAIAAIISVYIAFKQISKQHRNNLDAQKEQAKRETKIQIFKEISEILDLEGAAIRDVHSYCFSKKYSNMEMKAPLEHAEFHELCNRFGRAILVVVGKVESHEIINFKLFRAFRFGLQSIHHDLLKLRTEADRFKVLEEVVELANNTLMYFYDFQICMQNISYGDVFDSEVPSREPADPVVKSS